MIKKKLPPEKKQFLFVPNKSFGLTDWVPNINDNYNSIVTDSWFDINICENIPNDQLDTHFVQTSVIPKNSYNQQIKSIRRRKLDKVPSFICTKKVRLFPSTNQKIILNEWFDAATRMFNITVVFIRSMIYHNNKLCNLDYVYDIIHCTDYRYFLKEDRDVIIAAMKHPIAVHILDEVIQQVVSNHQSCLTNLTEGHIKKFRVRTQSYIRRRHTLKLEAGFFRKGSFCISTFPNIDSSEPLENIISTCTLLYDRDVHKYILLVPISRGEEDRISTVNDCGVDLGIRTFATAYSSANVVTIGNDLYKKIEKYHHKIDKINELLTISKTEKEVFVTKKIVVKKEIKIKEKTKIVGRKKIKTKDTTKIIKIKKEYVVPKKLNRRKLKKGLRKYHRKIQDMVKDLHFKSAHYLVKHYDNIYIGKLSTKSILTRNNKKITKQTKRMISVLSPFLYRQRLAYMGNKYGCFVGEVDEYLTTKTCPNCGKINEIGTKKIHKCTCGMRTDRDVASGKNMLKKGYVTYTELADNDLEIYQTANKKVHVMYNKTHDVYDIVEV